MKVELYVETGASIEYDDIILGTPFISGTFITPTTSGSSLDYDGNFKLLVPATRSLSAGTGEVRQRITGSIVRVFDIKNKEFTGQTKFYSNTNYTGTNYTTTGSYFSYDIALVGSGNPLFGAGDNIRSLIVDTGSIVSIASKLPDNTYINLQQYTSSGNYNTTAYSGNKPLVTGSDGVNLVGIETKNALVNLSGSYINDFGVSPTVSVVNPFIVSGSTLVSLTYLVSGDVVIPSGSNSGSFVLKLVNTNTTGSFLYDVNFTSLNETQLVHSGSSFNTSSIKPIGFPDYEYGSITSQSVVTYDRLDMFDDENISMKFKLKDSTDLSKVFSTYSQTFTIPASDKNNRIIKYFFNTEVERTAQRYIKSKIYINSELFKTGLIAINAGKLKNLNNSSYSINFFTSLTNLKELVGEDLISSVFEDKYNILWTDRNAFDYTRGLAVSASLDPDVIAPLVSNKRVWSYGDSSANDIKYNGTNSGVKSIETNELRPAIPFSKIMDNIASKYGLTFNSSLFEKDEYKKLYAWCNGVVSANTFNILGLSPSWDVFLPGSYTLTNNTTTDVISITYSGGYVTDNLSIIKLQFDASKIFASNDDLITNVKLINVDTNDVMYSSEMTILTGGTFESVFTFNALNLGISPTNPLNIRIEYSFSQPAYIVNGLLLFSSTTSFINASSPIVPNTINDFTFDLYQMLPSIKVIDFLTSFIKTFNISVIEDKENINVLNFVPRNEFYSETIDYTPYVDIEEVNIKPQQLYKKLNFKHKTPKYKSNVDYKIANATNINGDEYGELSYIDSDKFLKDEYSIETNYTIVPNRLIPNTKTQTFYGFTSDTPTDSTSYGKLYKPNAEDFTIFYYNGAQQLKDNINTDIAFNYKVNSGSISIYKLETYNKVSIVFDDVKSTYINSLGFKPEVDVFDNSFIFNNNLFSNYYQNDINRLYNANTRLFEYNCVLPSSVIKDFSLLNVLIIGDKRFSIEEADINILNGKSKLLLMNYSPVVLTEITGADTTPPINPDVFFGNLI